MILIPEPNEDGVRIYGKWPGNPRGFKEDQHRCFVEIPTYRGSFLFCQCRGRRGHGKSGLFCKRHAEVGEVKP